MNEEDDQKRIQEMTLAEWIENQIEIYHAMGMFADKAKMQNVKELFGACNRLLQNLDNGKALTGAFENIRAALAKARGAPEEPF